MGAGAAGGGMGSAGAAGGGTGIGAGGSGIPGIVFGIAIGSCGAGIVGIGGIDFAAFFVSSIRVSNPFFASEDNAVALSRIAVNAVVISLTILILF